MKCGVCSRSDILQVEAGFELSKNKWGFDICLFIVIVITHRRFSIINNGGGLKLTPPGYPRASCLGVKQTTGGSTPPTPWQFKHWVEVNHRNTLIQGWGFVEPLYIYIFIHQNGSIKKNVCIYIYIYALVPKL
jgi:hypothetical protein